MMPNDERAYKERLERMTAAAITGLCAHPEIGGRHPSDLGVRAAGIAIAALREIDQAVVEKVRGS